MFNNQNEIKKNVLNKYNNRNISILSDKIKKIKKVHIKSSTSKNYSNKNFCRYNSTKKRVQHTVKNLPLFTIEIKDLVKRYNKIKDEAKIERIKYLENDVFIQDKINSIIETKEDLLMFKLKRKFFENNFPHKKHIILKENKKDTFVKKLVNYVEYLDKPFEIKLNNTNNQ